MSSPHSPPLGFYCLPLENGTFTMVQATVGKSITPKIVSTLAAINYAL